MAMSCRIFRGLSQYYAGDNEALKEVFKLWKYIRFGKYSIAGGRQYVIQNDGTTAHSMKITEIWFAAAAFC